MPHSAVVVGRRRPRRTYASGSVSSSPVWRPGGRLPRRRRTGGAPAGPRRGSRTLYLPHGLRRGQRRPRRLARPRQGRGLASVDSVVFLGAAGHRRRRLGRPAAARKNWVDARVPRTARHRPRRARPADGPSPRPRRPAHDRHGGRPPRAAPAGPGSTSRCRATGSSTAPSAWPRSPTSCAERSPQTSRSSSSASPTASRSRAGSRGRRRPAHPRS